MLQETCFTPIGENISRQTTKVLWEISFLEKHPLFKSQLSHFAYFNF